MSDMKVLIFGGIYNNYLALEALLEAAEREGVDEIYFLGDVGGFGPYPDRVFPYLREAKNLFLMQGNYDHSIGNRLEDCACGYTDPRDNYFAQISYDYTLEHTSDENKDFLRTFAPEFRRDWAGKRVLMAHGSPRRINEFLWESTSPVGFLDYILKSSDSDVLFVTHTGIPWMREFRDGRKVVNVGAIGRPANNGKTTVDYVIVNTHTLDITFHELAYDHVRLASEMAAEGLPDPFVQTILTGWWTTCLEVLPARERARGIH